MPWGWDPGRAARVSAEEGSEVVFEIHEEGWGSFARVEAESGEQALELVAERFPRRAADYNGYVGPVTWSAFLADSDDSAAATVVLQVSA